MASSHKKSSSRAALTRRTTKGPLDVDDPLSASDTLSTRSATGTVSTFSKSTEALDERTGYAALPTITATDVKTSSAPTLDKDLSFLLDTAIYHPLGQIDVPAPFRKPFPPPPPLNTSIGQVFADLDTLLEQCDFIGAAHLSALALTTGLVSPTDADSIFHLLSIRYSSLELCGNVLLAAQEAKALEDLSSTFYYYEDTLLEDTDTSGKSRPLPQHIVPFDLRIQAIRLQSIGFSDSRRGVSALYDLGFECREHLSSIQTDPDKIRLWQDRLEDIGIRVVNALVEMGDLDCAYRTLENMKPDASDNRNQWVARSILLCIKMGKISKAESLLQTIDMNDSERATYDSMLLVADGNFEEAAKVLSTPSGSNATAATLIIAKQNLAVAYLYCGQISRCRKILEGLIDDRHTFQTLTVNLATIYELSSEKARDFKLGMANKIATRPSSTEFKRPYMNQDFKL